MCGHPQLLWAFFNSVWGSHLNLPLRKPLSSCVDRIHHPQAADPYECRGITVFITAGHVLEAAHQYKNEKL